MFEPIVERNRNLVRTRFSLVQERQYERVFGQEIAPGQDFDRLRIYRCAHCRRLLPYGNGGGACTDLPLAADELEHLEKCCDRCWLTVTSLISDIYGRHGLWSEESDGKRL